MRKRSPVATSQIAIVPSLPALASRRLSGLKATPSDRHCMPSESVQELADFGVPQFNGKPEISTAASDSRSVRTEGYAEDAMLMSG